MGLLPLLSPELYAGFPEWARTILGSGVVAGTLTAVVLTALLGRSGPVYEPPEFSHPSREPS